MFILTFFWAFLSQKPGSILHFGDFFCRDNEGGDSLQLQAIALSSKHFEEISPIDIPFIFWREILPSPEYRKMDSYWIETVFV